MTQPAVPRPHHVVPGQSGGGDEARVVVRERRPEDLPVLLSLLQRTHELEGYPVRPGAVRADWIAAPGELFGAVAVAGERVIGHVSLQRADDPGDADALAKWQEATGRPAVGLAVVSRFFTDRSTPGAGTSLLAHAVVRATDMNRVAVLLVDPDSPARDFYRRRGWHEIGSALQQWGHLTIDAVLMVSVQPIRAADRRQ